MALKQCTHRCISCSGLSRLHSARSQARQLECSRRMMAQQHVSSRHKGRSAPRSRAMLAPLRRSQVSLCAHEILDSSAETSRGT